MRIGRLFMAAALGVAAMPAAYAAEAYTAEAGGDAGNVRTSAQASLRGAAAADAELQAFYASRNFRPLWTVGGTVTPAADRLIRLLETADLDGLDPQDYRPRALSAAVARARSGAPAALAEVEMLLSRSFADYVRDMRRPSNSGMVYVDRALAPSVPARREVLSAAAAAPSLEMYIDSLGWMHPVYAGLRRSMDSGNGRVRLSERQTLRANLERARALPASAEGRHILVDAAGARLFLYENGRVVDTMRVVVGKTTEPTPMLAGMIRFAMVNPYWNVPPDLARNRIAAGVLSEGVGYLRARRYQVLSDWSEDARVVDPATVDWQAVADGREELRVRQLPGGANAMGNVKFMFPNDFGVYLHDTPDKALFQEANRQFSSGCVRLEDAPRLARWLFGRTLRTGSTPEQRVDLPDPVPVYITYLTAMPEAGGRIAFQADVYNRDAAQMAGGGGDGTLAAR